MLLYKLFSVVFIPSILNLLFSNSNITEKFIAKTSIEILFTPAIYKIIAFLKKKENLDHFDTHTNFNPFIFK
ncbi:MAG: hypothetical protein RLZZ625_19 [Pseudomonadota bacterium]